MPNIAVYPGTFDPITNGHTDLVTRASRLCDKVIVAVAEHTAKNTVCDTAQRVELAKIALAGCDNVEVVAFEGLLVDFCTNAGANLVIRGLLLDRKGAHCLTTALEHNSVLRPLEHLRRDKGTEVTYLEPQADGCLDTTELIAAAREGTQLIAVTQASNVTGCVQPVAEIARLAAELKIPLLIDASQSAGAVDLNHEALPGRVFVAFAGHKGLFGPSGTALGFSVVLTVVLGRRFSRRRRR